MFFFDGTLEILVLANKLHTTQKHYRLYKIIGKFLPATPLRNYLIEVCSAIALKSISNFKFRKHENQILNPNYGT